MWQRRNDVLEIENSLAAISASEKNLWRGKRVGRWIGLSYETYFTTKKRKAIEPDSDLQFNPPRYIKALRYSRTKTLCENKRYRRKQSWSNKGSFSVYQKSLILRTIYSWWHSNHVTSWCKMLNLEKETNNNQLSAKQPTRTNLTNNQHFPPHLLFLRAL